ncbi:hypothetical protein [Rickettsiella endosymbiont of Dermanyssus gallinae]|uniref:hypothetical protein n=1 Tax=Rickettsiella endosymbiont of Dermanyssus gallinae TaxID=2856608 RepID=UPI001C5340CF|nr:hypothetical protein [Rickettsiella endosymbiont of Dermanyssus gallinae]
MLSCLIDGANIIATFPLPEENVPEQIREMVLREIKIGHCSAQFFNTPKDAPYLTKEDKTFWQQIDSFFGGGEKKAPLVKEAQKGSFIPLPLFIEGPLPS